MSNPRDDLTKVRSAIDAIDNQMLALIDQRLQLAKSLRALKPAERAAWAPAREHALFQRLLDQKSTALPTQTMVSMWSALITCSLMTQGPMVLLCSDDNSISWARAAFPGAPTAPLDMDNWRTQTAETPGAIAMLGYPQQNQLWWCDLVEPGPRLYVQSVLPKWPPHTPTTCCLSADPPEYRNGQVCWAVIDQRSTHPADRRLIAQAKGLALIETTSPVDLEALAGDGLFSPIFIGSFFPPLVQKKPND